MFPDVKVYYQPPSRLEYPCILYELDDIDTKKADNINYIKKRRYLLTYMSKTPDPKTIINGEQMLVEDALLGLPYCNFDRTYTADNVHHYLFSLFY